MLWLVNDIALKTNGIEACNMINFQLKCVKCELLFISELKLILKAFHVTQAVRELANLYTE